ncbi:MAG: hypothetical protein PHT60_14530 [Acidiphilium sp.]|nr:hypothetical protein [Acidiphilium sp.]MDD4936978.1 hypothetical protein [Acidiphilium sp.]
MPVTSFAFDDRTMQAIAELRKIFGVSSNAAALRRAITLSQVVADQRDDKNTVLIQGKEHPIKVSLSG